MAKLDQSFIKAYGHVGTRATAASARPTPAPSALPLISATPIVVDASPFAIDACGALGEPPAATHPIESAPATSQTSVPRPHIAVSSPTPAQTPRKTRRGPVKRSEEKEDPTAAAAPLAATFQADSFTIDTASAEMKPPIAKPAAPAKPVETRRQPPRASAIALCHRACTVEFSTVADTSLETDETDSDLVEDAAEDFTADDSRQALVAEPQAAAAPRIDGVAYRRMTAPNVPALRTGYEVDAFRWPEVVDGLGARATTALATLIDELVDASSSGRNVVMFAGQRRGAGATTLAAYAARRLAQLGPSVALVDADFAKPALARSLGVAVEYGWDDALEAQAEPNAAMIGSLGDGVALLPLRRATFGVTEVRAARIAADLVLLRKHFALVIVDGGPLAEVAEPWLAHAPHDTVDCGVVVRDVRVHNARPTPSRTHAPRSAALPAIGIVENFVAESPATKE